MYSDNKQQKNDCYPFVFEEETKLEAEVLENHCEETSQEKSLREIRYCSCGCVIYPDEEFCSRCGRPVSIAKTYEEIAEKERVKSQRRSAMNVVYAPPEIMEQLFHKREEKVKK